MTPNFSPFAYIHASLQVVRKVFHSKVPNGKPLKKDDAQSLTLRAQFLTLNFLRGVES